MRAVMKSVPPNLCEKIASGECTVLVSKTTPKLKIPFKCYIYCTNEQHELEVLLIDDMDHRVIVGDYRNAENGLNIGNGKVIGEFICDKVYNIISIDPLPWGGALDYAFKFDFKKTCLSVEEFNNCLDGGSGYGIHISDLKIYDKPKELREFRKPCIFEGKDTICYLFCIHCKSNGGLFFDCDRRITRPPKSMYYVEELAN